MNPVYLSALAALAGSAIGGLTSLAQLGSLSTVRIAPDDSRRTRSDGKSCTSSFIDEASKLYADALVHDQAEVSALVSVYALINRMRVLSRSDVVKRAEAVVRTIVETCFAPNKTFPELRKLMNSHAIDPLRAFSEICRAESQTLKAP